MPQVHEPGCPVAFQAVRHVRKMRSPPRYAMRVVRKRVAQLGQLAHLSRVVILGQLAASMTSEVNQTITASFVNGKAGLRWLAEAESTPRIEKTREALRRTVRDGERAAFVINGIRAVFNSVARPSVDLNDIVGQVTVLAHSGIVVECRGRHW